MEICDTVGLTHFVKTLPQGLDTEMNEYNKKIDNLKKEFVTLNSIEEKLESQEQRINRLEMNLEKVLSMLENIDDSGITDKVDKIEKQISKLTNNIEKLAAYVD